MHSTSYLKLALLVSVLLAVSVVHSEARGGRRGGGSLGGIFGGWRKYKKPSSGGNHGRRNMNSSPLHSTASKSSSSSNSGGSSASSLSTKAKTQSKTQSSYPKQPTAGAPYGGYGYGAQSGYYGGGAPAAGAAYMPAGSTYYANTAAMPAGAIYYAQPPVYSSGGTGNFLLGMMTGNLLFGHRPYVTHHVYHQQQPQAASNNNGNGKTIIIENRNGTTTVRELSANSSGASTATTQQPQFWPTDTLVPLAAFNDTITPSDTIKPDVVPIYQSALPNYQAPGAAGAAGAGVTEQYAPSNNDAGVTPPQPPTGGIICVPVLLNETDPNEPSKQHSVERIICYPAPPPPPPNMAAPSSMTASSAAAASPRCALRTFIESDPNEPTKTIEVQKEYCQPVATANSIQVAGEIGDNNGASTEPNNRPTTTTATAMETVGISTTDKGVTTAGTGTVTGAVITGTSTMTITTPTADAAAVWSSTSERHSEPVTDS